MENTVSCIIPTYNNGEELVRAVKSVIGSNYRFKEIIVVDDGSKTDFAKTVLNDFRPLSGINPVYLYQRNQGPSAARNAGLTRATSTWVAFLDADDTMLPDSVTDKLEWVAHVDEPGQVGGVYGSFVWSSSGEVQPFAREQISVRRDDIGRFGRAPGGVPSYLLQRRAVAEVGGFDESMWFNEDFDLILRMMKRGYKVVGTDSPGFIRNVSGVSLTRRDKSRSLVGGRRFLLKAWREGLLSRREIVRRMGVNYLSHCRQLFRSSD